MRKSGENISDINIMALSLVLVSSENELHRLILLKTFHVLHKTVTVVHYSVVWVPETYLKISGSCYFSKKQCREKATQPLASSLPRT